MTNATGISRKRIALFGGAFDPIHNGHLAAIAALVNSVLFDQVLVLPSGDRPDKPACTPAALRQEMCRIAIEESFQGTAAVVLSDLHSAQRVGYGTIDVVRYLQAGGACDVSVVIGHELVAQLHTWKEADALKREAQFVVMKRPGLDIPSIPEGWRITFFQNPNDVGVNVSSTVLRAMLKEERSCAGLMPACVERMYRR